jgi:integrase
MTWAGLRCVLLAAARFDEATAFPGHYALLPVAGAVLVLAGGRTPVRYGAGSYTNPRFYIPRTFPAGTTPWFAAITTGLNHRSTVKNTLAVLVRVMEQAVRDGLITANPARIKGWQRQYQLAEDELDDPRSLALRNWAALQELAAALVARSADQYPGWGDAVTFAACTAARIGEVSGARIKDIDLTNWNWTVRRQTTPSPRGLADKNTKGKVARRVPLIQEVRPIVAQRVLAAGGRPDARLFTGPRGGRITTAVLRDATH